MSCAAITAPPSINSRFSPSSVNPNFINSAQFSLQNLKQIHAHLIRTGEFRSSTSLLKLIAAFCTTPSSASLNYVLQAFNLLQNDVLQQNQFIYNSLIRGLCSVGCVDDAAEIFVQMMNRDVPLDRFSFPPILTACSKTGNFDVGIQMHGLVVKLGGEVKFDLYVCNSLIHFYSEFGDMDAAQTVFDEMSERNVVSWTCLIDGYARGDDPRAAIYAFDKMVNTCEILPNSVTMACVVSACAKLQDRELGERVHDYILEKSIGLTTGLVNSLVNMYMKCGSVKKAEQIFGDCTERNTVLWNTMIFNYTRCGMATESLRMLNQMLAAKMRPDRVTLVASISATSQLGDLSVGRQFHGYVLRHGLYVWDSVSNSVMDMYMKCGDSNSGCRVFDMMTDKTVVSWNTIIAGCFRNGDLESAWRNFDLMPERDLITWNTMIDSLVQENFFYEAIEMFRLMQSSGINPDRVTMVSLASACANLGGLDLAKWIITYIKKKGIILDVKLYTALIDMLARCGDPKISMQLFEEMTVKDVSAWTAAIGALALEGNGERALILFEKMIKQGINPDERLFVEILTACSHSGLVEQGCHLFESMINVHGIPAKIIHYGCMVDILGRAGQLKEALDFIKNMPMEPNDVIWSSLLAASRVHNNIEMAEYAAKKVMRLNPQKAGVHVLLSNIYASVGRWNDVSKVRLSLKEKGVSKFPGCSKIEIDGVIHEFISSDESHPQTARITEMLHEIGDKLDTCGYVPDLDSVLLDVDEDEKEFLLNRHSEKISVAFGLISTARGTTIRVIKNLRICSDCHSFMKFVSDIYDREIIVRDNNRFHRFRKGMCSCKDFW